MLLFLISLAAGVLTILAPCTLPLLPIIVGSSLSQGEKAGGRWRKALTIALSLGASIFIFTFLLKASTALISVPQSVWSTISGSIILLFGVISVWPGVWEQLSFVNKVNIRSNKLMGAGLGRNSFWGDVMIGASLGPIFSTCSPTYFVILATVLPESLARGVLYLLAYIAGLVGVLLLVAWLGQKLVSRLGILSNTHGRFRRGLGVLFIVIGVLILFGVDKKLEAGLLQAGLGDITRVEQKLLSLNDAEQQELDQLNESKLPLAPEIVDPSGFVNTKGKPITIEQFRGNKVVLLDIWTYSCINCQRTLPYLNAWYQKYHDQGLEIIGLHTPEFAFEHKLENVAAAVERFGIKYPVVLDNDYATWRAYGNQYWPRKYLINADGRIVYDHIGEGSYEETEREIQKALMDLSMKTGAAAVIPTAVAKPDDEVVVERDKVASPEVYFGAARNEYLANGKSNQAGEQSFTLPSSYAKGGLYLSGAWNLSPESATALSAAGVVYRYQAKDVYAVLSAPSPTEVVVKVDGEVMETLTVQGETLYTLVGGVDYGEHLLELEVPAGVVFYTFTFG